MDITFVLPPESPIEKNRNTRQVSYGLWEFAGYTRRRSGHLCAQSTALLLTSQALGDRWKRLASCPDAAQGS